MFVDEGIRKQKYQLSQSYRDILTSHTIRGPRIQDHFTLDVAKYL